MKILYITLENLSLHKGSVIHVREVIEGLRKRGHQVTLIAGSRTSYENVEGFYNIHPEKLFPFKYFRLKKKLYVISSILIFLYLFKLLRHCDVVYARDYHTAIIALFPRLIFKKRLVYEINGIAHEEHKLKSNSAVNYILVLLIREAEKWAARYSDMIICVTDQIGAYLVRNYGCPPDRVKVIGNGVNTKKFYPIYDEPLLWTWRKKLGITKEDVVIAFVGNLAPWQGVNILIESAFQLLNNHENLKFLIVGEGFVRDSIEKRVSESEYQKNFIFTGMIEYENIPILINIADICVAPFISRRNRTTGVSPVKVFEYMACGKPVICSRIEGLEFIEAEGVGYLVDPENVMSLRKKLLELIESPQERMSMGNRGVQIARTKYDWELKSTLIEKLLKSLA